MRAGQGPEQLTREQFTARYRERFSDPVFTPHAEAIGELLQIGWDAYKNSRRSPRTQKAGAGFADPDYDLSVEWLATREAIERAQREHDDPARKSRVLLICASARNDKSGPGEISKSFRMVELSSPAPSWTPMVLKRTCWI